MYVFRTTNAVSKIRKRNSIDYILHLLQKSTPINWFLVFVCVKFLNARQQVNSICLRNNFCNFVLEHFSFQLNVKF